MSSLSRDQYTSAVVKLRRDSPQLNSQAVVTATISLRLDAVRPRYDHSTTYVTTVGLPVVGCCTVVYISK